MSEDLKARHSKPCVNTRHDKHERHERHERCSGKKREKIEKKKREDPTNVWEIE